MYLTLPDYTRLWVDWGWVGVADSDSLITWLTVLIAHPHPWVCPKVIINLTKDNLIKLLGNSKDFGSTVPEPPGKDKYRLLIINHNNITIHPNWQSLSDKFKFWRISTAYLALDERTKSPAMGPRKMCKFLGSASYFFANYQTKLGFKSETEATDLQPARLGTNEKLSQEQTTHTQKNPQIEARNSEHPLGHDYRLAETKFIQHKRRSGPIPRL